MDAPPLVATEPPRRVLSYRNPATGRRPVDVGNPLYPLGLAVLSAGFGLSMPNQAGGSAWAWLAAFWLVIAACWYIAARLWRDPETPDSRRPLLLILGIIPLLLAAVAAALGGLEMAIDRWQAYGETPRLFAAAMIAVGVYAVVRMAARTATRRGGEGSRSALEARQGRE